MTVTRKVEITYETPDDASADAFERRFLNEFANWGTGTGRPFRMQPVAFSSSRYPSWVPQPNGLWGPS